MMKAEDAEPVCMAVKKLTKLLMSMGVGSDVFVSDIVSIKEIIKTLLKLDPVYRACIYMLDDNEQDFLDRQGLWNLETAQWVAKKLHEGKPIVR